MIFEILESAWKYAPDIAIVGMGIYAVIWITIKINNFGHRLNNFDHRLEATERTLNDIQNKQLPEIRDRLTAIEAVLIRLDTFLSTKFKDYPRA